MKTLEAYSQKLNKKIEIHIKGFEVDIDDVICKIDLISNKKTFEQSTRDFDYMFPEKQGTLCINLDNKFLNEELIGKKKSGYMPITKGSKEDIEEIKQKAKDFKKEKRDEELSNLTDDKTIISKLVFHSSGKGYLVMNKDINLASDYVERMIKLVDERNLINWNMDWDSFEETELNFGWLRKESEKIQNEINSKKEQKENERKAIFEEAKKTNKPVELYRYFLSDQQIPYQHRVPDSDMGHLIGYAMPDGSVKEEFNHAY